MAALTTGSLFRDFDYWPLNGGSTAFKLKLPVVLLIKLRKVVLLSICESYWGVLSGPRASSKCLVS